MGVLAQTDLPRGANLDWTIPQGFERYGEADHRIWTTLYERQADILPERACDAFLHGLDALDLHGRGIPDFRQLNETLLALTGWRIVAVPGLVPDAVFFDHLANRRFPAGNFIRGADELDYLKEPDIFHDVFGHVPMHAHPVFADFLQHYGSICAKAKDAEILERLGRLFWYTVEFGLIRQHGKIRVYGSGVISSHKECTNVIDEGCDIRDFNLDEVLATEVKVDEIQKRLFAIESFDQIYEAVREAEKRLCGNR